MLAILFVVILHAIDIHYYILIMKLLSLNIISSIIDASKFISNGDNWIIYKNAFFPLPLESLDATEFDCSVRPDIGPVDVVYTWVNGSDPEFIKNLETMKMVKKTSSKRFYGGFFEVMIGEIIEIQI